MQRLNLKIKKLRDRNKNRDSNLKMWEPYWWFYILWYENLIKLTRKNMVTFYPENGGHTWNMSSSFIKF